MLRLARATLWFLLMGVGLPQGHRLEGVLWAITKGFFSVKFRIVDFLLSSQFPQRGNRWKGLCSVVYGLDKDCEKME